MPYGRQHLPFIGFHEMVNKAKKAFDNRGGRYPLEIRVTTADGAKLLSLTAWNVWDRKSPISIEDREWDAPLNFEVWEHGELDFSIQLLTVEVEEDLQLSIADLEAEL